MKAKPNIDNFFDGGAAAAAEKTAPVAASGDEKITKTFRLTKAMEVRLKEAAFRQSVAAGKRVTESDIIKAALNTYLSK